MSPLTLGVAWLLLSYSKHPTETLFAAAMLCATIMMKVYYWSGFIEHNDALRIFGGLLLVTVIVDGAVAITVRHLPRDLIETIAMALTTVFISAAALRGAVRRSQARPLRHR